jgi:hypothetical protein
VNIICRIFGSNRRFYIILKKFNINFNTNILLIVLNQNIDFIKVIIII